MRGSGGLVGVVKNDGSDVISDMKNKVSDMNCYDAELVGENNVRNNGEAYADEYKRGLNNGENGFNVQLVEGSLKHTRIHGELDAKKETKINEKTIKKTKLSLDDKEKNVETEVKFENEKQKAGKKQEKDGWSEEGKNEEIDLNDGETLKAAMYIQAGFKKKMKMKKILGQTPAMHNDIPPTLPQSSIAQPSSFKQPSLTKKPLLTTSQQTPPLQPSTTLPHPSCSTIVAPHPPTEAEEVLDIDLKDDAVIQATQLIQARFKKKKIIKSSNKDLNINKTNEKDKQEFSYEFIEKSSTEISMNEMSEVSISKSLKPNKTENNGCKKDILKGNDDKNYSQKEEKHEKQIDGDVLDINLKDENVIKMTGLIQKKFRKTMGLRREKKEKKIEENSNITYTVTGKDAEVGGSTKTIEKISESTGNPGSLTNSTQVPLHASPLLSAICLSARS